jgi:hypothetical protein
MENNSGKEQLKGSAAPSGKEKLKLANTGDLEVRELIPQENKAGRVQVDGTVTFNDSLTVSVTYPEPSAVIPGQIIGSYDDGNFTKVSTVQKNGGSNTVYLFYIDAGDNRQYYESANPNGIPMNAIDTVTYNDDFLRMWLEIGAASDKPIIVIGTIIIETEEEA